MDEAEKSDDMKAFEVWMKRFWAGVPVVWLEQECEFQGLVQAAWEVWIFRRLSAEAQAEVLKASER